MDGMTADSIKKQLLDETPVQWCVLLEMADRRLDQYGFSSLRDFIVTGIDKGGLGIPLERAKELMYFNTSYKHKADKLAKKIGLAELAKGVDALDEHGGEREQVDKNKNVNLGGNSATYRIAKLKRDHPDVAERLEGGEFKTVSDAERAAGTRGRKMTQAEKAYRVVMRLTEEEREEFNLLMGDNQ